MYRGGYLRAASVGFVPIRWEDGKDKSNFKRRYVEQELLEVSAVSIPANPNALALAIKDGVVEKSDLRELAMVLRHLENDLAGTPNKRRFCNDQAGPAADARAPGRATDGAQWLQLVREVIELAERM
jgi:hypothetical protein